MGGENFALAEGGADGKIILLDTQSNVHHLGEAECLYMGGTFETCPIFITKYFQCVSSNTWVTSYGVCSASKQTAEYIGSDADDA